MSDTLTTARPLYAVKLNDHAYTMLAHLLDDLTLHTEGDVFTAAEIGRLKMARRVLNACPTVSAND